MVLLLRIVSILDNCGSELRVKNTIAGLWSIVIATDTNLVCTTSDVLRCHSIPSHFNGVL